MDYALLFEQFSQKNGLAGWSSQRRLHACLRNAIQAGSLPSGTRLLASRILAQELRIARNIVVYAYEQLATEGFLVTNRRGSVVAESVRPSSTLFNRHEVQLPPRTLAQRAQSVMSFPVSSELTSGFAPGVPALDEFPMGTWRQLLDRTWRNLSSKQLGYVDAAGELDLRIAISDYLRVSRGVDCLAEQVIITDGTQSSLLLCAHALANPKDKVWIENPGYVGAQIAFRTEQLQIIGISVDGEGICPKANDWVQHKPKLIYLTPSHQYPTGSVLSLARRFQLIDQALTTGALIIEDDYDSEFRHDGPPLPAMQGLVPNAPVLYLGTFSKTLFPALRIAYMVVPKNLVVAVTDYVAKTALRGRSADQLCLAQFIRDGHFALHLRRMRRLYRQRRDALVAAVKKHLDKMVFIRGESAGMHLVLCFRDASIDDVKVSSAIRAQGIVAPALSMHTVGKRRQRWKGLMLGYAQVSEEETNYLVAKLATVIRHTL